MPRLQDVTDEELQAIVDNAEDLAAGLTHIQSRLERTVISGTVKNPLELVRRFISLARAASETAMALTHGPALDEIRRSTEETIRKRMDERK